MRVRYQWTVEYKKTIKKMRNLSLTLFWMGEGSGVMGGAAGNVFVVVGGSLVGAIMRVSRMAWAVSEVMMGVMRLLLLVSVSNLKQTWTVGQRRKRSWSRTILADVV